MRFSVPVEETDLAEPSRAMEVKPGVSLYDPYVSKVGSDFSKENQLTRREYQNMS